MAISSLGDICSYLHAEGEICRDGCPVRRLVDQIDALHGIQIRVNDQLQRIVLQS